MEKFYYVSKCRKQGQIRVESVTPYDWMNLYKGIDTPIGILKVKKDAGRNFYDFTGFQDVYNVMISDRLHDILIQYHNTGWKTYPIELLDYPHIYHGFQVVGRCGPILPREPGFQIGIDFERSTWDGSDIFLMKNTQVTLCTERARRVLQENKVTNVEFTLIETMRSYYPEKETRLWKSFKAIFKR